MVSPFFGPQIGEEGLRRNITGFSAQMRWETKQTKRTRSSPQISGVLVSHRMVLGRAAPLATPIKRNLSLPSPTGSFYVSKVARRTELID